MTNGPFFVLAPMDDVTDVVFRSIVAECAPPDMYFTEFVNVDGLQSIGRPKLIHKLAIDKNSDRNIVAQIWGKKPENFEKTANEIVDMGFHGVDLNMGCPQKNEVKNGCCSALINDRDLASVLIKAVQRGVDGKIPVSVKTRLGWNEIDLSWHELLLEQKIDMLTVHMRTRKEMSSVPAHWEVMKEIVKLRDKISPNTKLVINGDIETRAQGLEVAKNTGADGVMIGRGIFKDPFCFSENSPWESMPPSQKAELFLKHLNRFQETYVNGERSYQTLKKFCKTYIHGFDQASDLREKIMQTQTAEELVSLLNSVVA